MQLILTNKSKWLLLLVLSCVLIIVWRNSNNIIFPELDSSNTHSQSRLANSVWYSISNEFQLDHKTQTPSVQAEIRRLVADQDKFYRILKAASPYIYFIYQQTRERGLPGEIALIPFIESEFNPNDHSNKGALGLWQLMAGTAHDLGIKMRVGYDGRRNIVDSTQAALAYFKDLGNNFDGDWYLAIAAYNCGQGKVTSAMRRSGSDSFWKLPLPRETKYYVPRLLAVAEIIENPEKYGMQLPPVTNEPYFAEVKVTKSVSLNKVAKTTGISIKTLHKLNPAYRNGVVSKTENSLLVPVDKVPAVTNKLPVK
ncbi:MAG: hypothetical protein A3E83_09020 [Gammaproteobacteria bacterium RIFCSPHIGHO2_12_FULL_41_20]|nr:MAG: hypothetical protein A3E83_09020 [Gammaproteobacteria bacterium RIFCSPHIGHO2_12_FULL_41_20]